MPRPLGRLKSFEEVKNLHELSREVRERAREACEHARAVITRIDHFERARRHRLTLARRSQNEEK